MADEAGAQAAPILIVDDDDDLRPLLLQAVHRAGLAAIGASSGEEAMTLIMQQPISLVVCDVHLPGMSGLDMVRQLRRRPETATLPILLITGSGSDGDVIEGLEAGADDFLSKPIRLDELVARVRANLRTQGVWVSLRDTEMQSRADAVRAIGQLPLSADPEAIAEAVVTELANRTGSHTVGVFQLSVGNRLLPLARYLGDLGVVRGGASMEPSRVRKLLTRVREGPWSEHIGPPAPGEAADPFWTDSPDIGAAAPIYFGGDVVGLLTIGANLPPGAAAVPVRAKLLAGAIDYASVLSAVAGHAIADRRTAQAERDRLRSLLLNGDFHIVYQPIVHLQTGESTGFEALTRFTDGTAPNVRFDEATAAGLGADFELASIRAALNGARSLAPGRFISLNISPSVLLFARRRLAKLIDTSDRPVVLEVTEHMPIDDYPAFRRAFNRLPGVSLAIDDAGAGFASLNHIVELSPKFVKLDISLVRGIDADLGRQGIAAGLAYFAARTGCSLIAEGVEQRAEADELVKLGVEFGQGYLFGRPEPITTP